MEQTGKNITIVDVAREAGVSKTTISRYLNGKFEFMSEESKQRIAEVIRALNYRPNNLARSLKSKKSRLVGVLVSDISSPFSSILLRGISDCCDRYGYGVLITSTDDDPRKERDYIMSMIDQRVEGLIINTTGQNNAFLQEVAKLGIPMILADRPIAPQSFDTVRSADYPVTMEVMTHLKARGYKMVGLFTEALSNGTRLSRASAYAAACRDILRVEPDVYVIEEKAQESARERLQAFMEKHEGERKAIFTTNGVATLRVVRALRELRLKFPEDVGVCGFDNWDWMALVDGGLTVVSQPTYKVGRECVKRMMFRLHRGKNAAPRLIELECQLLIRNST